MKKFSIDYITAKIRVALDKLAEISAIEFFDDGICQNELDEFWGSFVYETA